ncbi:MAG TPA: hypothetical protein VG737_10680, partial [Cyclobacteriaceae bacterium]|nr:hypothetical protein [Cyclobacteriaceae bacterium]
LPIDECPADFLHHFRNILESRHALDKIGFGIRIDDLPGCFKMKDEVVSYEKRYWGKEISPNVYDAPIDTTFALYTPLSNLKHGQSFTLSAVRVGFPYLIRHLPWYVDSSNLSSEEVYYLATSDASSSVAAQFRGEKKIY